MKNVKHLKLNFNRNPSRLQWKCVTLFFHMDFDTALKVQLIFHCESVQKRSMILNHNIFNYITEKGFYVAKVFLFLLVFIIQWT